VAVFHHSAPTLFYNRSGTNRPPWQPKADRHHRVCARSTLDDVTRQSAYDPELSRNRARSGCEQICSSQYTDL